jgi:MFS family permease
VVEKGIAESNGGLAAGLTAAVGLTSLASAMGIGRFAFTPLLPLMQQAYGLTLAQGAWLAAANYLGYLLGALASYRLSSRSTQLARWSLIIIGVTTLATALATSMTVWLLLRLISGMASAFVLVGAGSWALGHLAARGRPFLAGVVFGGVGVGICAAGLVALAMSRARHGPAAIWTVLGAIAALASVLVWRALAVPVPAAPSQTSETAEIGKSAWGLVACYGALGLGYILPATFLPAAARQIVDDPAVFGWSWPVFGLAAAFSTMAAATFFCNAPPRKVAGWSQLIMAVGVLAPLVRMSLATITISALCVGGTFMVITMAGAQEAKRLSRGSPARLMAALTAAFAVGQLVGPVLVAISNAGGDAFSIPSAIAATALVISAKVLLTREDCPPSTHARHLKGRS